jgi:hypothetical protein
MKEFIQNRDNHANQTLDDLLEEIDLMLGEFRKEPDCVFGIVGQCLWRLHSPRSMFAKYCEDDIFCRLEIAYLDTFENWADSVFLNLDINVLETNNENIKRHVTKLIKLYQKRTT